MQYGILRFQKMKSIGDITGGLKHNLRAQPTPNADRTIKNVVMKGMDSVDRCMDRYRKLLGDTKVRKNAVMAHEAVVTASPEKMHSMSRKEQIAYFNDALKWLNKLHGGSKNLISAVVHYDETTPHLQAIYAPIDAQGKLNSRAVLGGHRGRMSELQTDFAEVVGAKYGMDRGVRGSPAKHTTLKEFYRTVPTLQAEAEKLCNEISALQREYIELGAGVDSLRSDKASLEENIDTLSSKLKQVKELGLDDLRDFVSDLEEQLKNDARNERGVFRPGR